MGKKRIQEVRDIAIIRQRTKQALDNYYYDQWMSEYGFNGLSEDKPMNRKLSFFLMKQFYEFGTCAAFTIKRTTDVGLTQWSTHTFDYLSQPSTVNLINKWSVNFIPNTPQTVNKDVVIGYASYNHKPVKFLIDYYVNKLVDIEMIINTNLQLQKIPFILGISPEEQLKAEDLISRILNDEIAVIVDVRDLDLIKALTTNAPYIVDKLYAHKQAIEGELKTYLGIDNTANDPSKEFQLVDEINSNNGIINNNQNKFQDCIQDFVDDINEVLGKNVTISIKNKPIASVYDGQSQDDSLEKKQVTPGGDE